MRGTAKKILDKAKKIRLVAMDVDGVLTAGELIITDSGEEVKIWNIRDRFAYFILRRALPEVKLAYITARQSRQVKARADELKIDYIRLNSRDKAATLAEIAEEMKIRRENIAFLGDDWLDIPALRKAGLSVCPADAHDEVRKNADYISSYCGGKGVFRETVEIILRSRGIYRKTLSSYGI